MPTFCRVFAVLDHLLISFVVCRGLRLQSYSFLLVVDLLLFPLRLVLLLFERSSTSSSQYLRASKIVYISPFDDLVLLSLILDNTLAISLMYDRSEPSIDLGNS